MWKIVENQNWQYIRNTFSWIRDMESVAQDPIYHAEGNVAVHTKMVVEALLALPEYQQLKEQDQQILFAAALLHDVEKRSTTIKESDGRITSRKHALKGEFTTRTILYKEIATPFSVREKVAKLVRYHGLPIWIMEKNDPEAALLQASLEVDTQHLAILAKADMLGRICPDQEEMLYRIELFQEFCKELDCLGKPKWFGSDLGRYEYFKKRLDGQSITPDYVPFEKNTFEVILMCALPGTGKDFFIQKNFKDFLVVSLDDIRRKNKISPTDKRRNGKVIQMAKELARQHLRKKETFVWNATNITKNMRKQLVDLFQSCGAKTKIIYLEVPYEQLVKQNLNRKYPIPQKVLEKMISKLEIPNLWEAPNVEIL